MSKTTHIIAILDRSGSMGSLAVEVVSNFNKFLKEQQALPGKAKLTLAVFDNEVTVIHDKVKLTDVKPITNEYQIGGATAMYDGIGMTLAPLMDKKKAIVLIHTDGYENASKEYNKDTVKKMIDKKKDWEFIFVGADIDAADIGTGMGINLANTVSTTRSVGDLSASYDMFSTKSMAYRADTTEEKSI